MVKEVDRHREISTEAERHLRYLVIVKYRATL